VNTGIIVYSQTGNTLSVAQKLQEKLSAAGHSATLKEIEVVGEVAPGKAVQFKTAPDATPYEALVFGGPVQAFSLVQVIKAYLEQCAPLTGKPVACLTTQHFPYPWLGGNRAIRQMRRLCEAKGATVRGTGIVNWSKKGREEQIEAVTDELSRVF
jgi:flavodoxin